MRIKQLSGKAGEVMKVMPPLNIHIPNESDMSEVMKWMASQPDVLQWVVSKAVSTGKIERDVATGKWKGVDH